MTSRFSGGSTPGGPEPTSTVRGDGMATRPPRSAPRACARWRAASASKSNSPSESVPDMKIALDPTPFHHDYRLLDFPRVVADLGYEHLQLTPHRDFIPFFNHPRADDGLVAQFRKACADAGVGIASVLPVLRWSGPDEDDTEAGVWRWK